MAASQSCFAKGFVNLNIGVTVCDKNWSICEYVDLEMSISENVALCGFVGFSNKSNLFWGSSCLRYEFLNTEQLMLGMEAGVIILDRFPSLGLSVILRTNLNEKFQVSVKLGGSVLLYVSDALPRGPEIVLELEGKVSYAISKSFAVVGNYKMINQRLNLFGLGCTYIF